MKSLTVNAAKDNLAGVLEFITIELEAAGASMKTQFQIDLAVEEIFVNIVHFAYTPDTGDITIQCDIYGEPPWLKSNLLTRESPIIPLIIPSRILH